MGDSNPPVKNMSDRLRDKFSSVLHLPKTTYPPDRHKKKTTTSANTPQSQAWREMPRRATLPQSSPTTSPMPHLISRSSIQGSISDKPPTSKQSRSHSAPSPSLPQPPPLPRLKDSLAAFLPSRPAETHQQDAPPRRRCLFPTKEERNSAERRQITAESEKCRAELVKQGIKIRDFQFEEDCRRMIADQQWEKRLNAEGLTAGIPTDAVEVDRSAWPKSDARSEGDLCPAQAAGHESQVQDTIVTAGSNSKTSDRLTAL